jgi:nitrile hydratase
MSRFTVGDSVRVKEAYPTGHVRTPTFIRGKLGTIDSISGEYLNPEERAYGGAGIPKLTLYRVLFRQSDIWSGYAGATQDTAVVDIYETWLEKLA